MTVSPVRRCQRAAAVAAFHDSNKSFYHLGYPAVCSVGLEQTISFPRRSAFIHHVVLATLLHFAWNQLRSRSLLPAGQMTSVKKSSFFDFPFTTATRFSAILTLKSVPNFPYYHLKGVLSQHEYALTICDIYAPPPS